MFAVKRKDPYFEGGRIGNQLADLDGTRYAMGLWLERPAAHLRAREGGLPLRTASVSCWRSF